MTRDATTTPSGTVKAKSSETDLHIFAVTQPPYSRTIILQESVNNFPIQIIFIDGELRISALIRNDADRCFQLYFQIGLGKPKAR